MARMIPDIDPATIENSGEREMYRRLREQLPATWIVRHHFPACWLDGANLREPAKPFAQLDIHDARGEKVATLARGLGSPRIAWQAPNSAVTLK